MGNKLNLDITNVEMFIGEDEIYKMQPDVELAHNMLRNKTGVGNEFLGWLDLPIEVDKDEIEKIKSAAINIRKKAGILLVIGIGGSYLGARSAIEMLSHSFYNICGETRIFFAGNNISSTYLADLLDVVKNKDICINVISKSGTTTEPAIAFRVFKDLLEKKYGKEEARKRIFVTTDKSRGSLKAMAQLEGYETFVIPDNIGGRYSVLSSVGLLPIATAGINIENILKGAKDAAIDLSYGELSKNIAYKYAVIRNILYKKGYNIEILANFEPSMHFFGEWFKQLFGESEGKDGKGIFPSTADFSTDLHSIGQYIQQGRRNIFETFINVEKPKSEVLINNDEDNLDGLNFLSGKSVDFIRNQAYRGTKTAHNEGQVPIISLNLPEISEYHYGYMVYFFEIACAISGYLLGVNPFNQPGVEAYKKHMHAFISNPD